MKNIVLSGQLEIQLLLFLWKWKVSTSSALIHAFYEDRSNRMAYERLRKLETGKFIQSYTNRQGKKYLWTLGKLGFQSIRGHLPELREQGYLSEYPGHDLVAASIHMGSWLNDTPPTVVLFSEQQLRRYSLEQYPEGIPQSLTHRPDGYWLLGKGDSSQTIALEVELSEKRESEYKKMARFYGYHPSISKVIWLVRNPTMAKRIHTKIKSATERSDIHCFLTFEPFFQHGWQAPFEISPPHDSTLSKLLSYQYRTSIVPVRHWYVLDTRKSLHKSNNYNFYSLGDFVD